MLPIPVLDGGHIVLAIIESLRRKPVNMRVLEFVQTSCAVLIIGYMLYITFFDVQDLPFVRKQLDQLESQSTPKGTPAP
jgi:regulator of sigma E protease